MNRRLNRSGRRNEQFNQQRENSNGSCICLKCGYSQPHTRSIPCNSTLCPQCNTPLIRGSISNTPKHQESTSASTSKINYPQVNPELCVGCGLCIKKCPQNAIHLIDGKAVIDTTICKNCHLCVEICPKNAIK